MTQREKLLLITDKKEGLGIPLNVVARFCNCNSKSISNYIEGAEPTVRISHLIDNGIAKIVEIVKKLEG